MSICAVFAISTAIALGLVLCFEAPLLHVERLLFGLAGLGDMPKVNSYAVVAVGGGKKTEGEEEKEEEEKEEKKENGWVAGGDVPPPVKWFKVE